MCGAILIQEFAVCVNPQGSLASEGRADSTPNSPYRRFEESQEESWLI